MDILIWDGDTPPPATDHLIIMWKQFRTSDSSESTISLPEYVEAHASRFHSKFTQFVCDIGESVIDQKTVKEHLKIRENFSYWWLTLFASTRWHPHSRITEAVKLLALEEILSSRNWTSIELRTDSREINQVVSEICQQEKKMLRCDSQFAIRSNYSRPQSKIWNSIFKAHLIIVRRYFQTMKVKPLPTPISVSNIMIFDHLTRLNVNAARGGEFISQYWSLLIPILKDSQKDATWIHRFVAADETPTHQAAQKVLSALSDISNSRHYLFDSRPSIRNLTRTLFNFWNLVLARFRVRKINESFIPRDSKLNLFPLFADEWRESLIGPTAVHHLLALGTIEETLNRQPHCPIGLYLMENQPWEMALIHAWNQSGHGKLIGVIHAPIRFWDLRFFSDPRIISNQSNDYSKFRPSPSIYAVNSPISRRLLEDSGISAQVIVDVEALMYQYLVESAKNPIGQDILILGDYFTELTNRIISLAQPILKQIQPNQTVWFKPHPLNRDSVTSIEKLGIKVTHDMLSSLFDRSSVVIAPSASTGALEAYCANKQVISVLDPSTMNFSPMRHVEGAIFIANTEELLTAIKPVPTSEKSTSAPLLFLDKGLPFWKKLLD